MSEETSGRGRRDAGDDERLEVLRLVQAGEITADEAAQLLDALDRPDTGTRGASDRSGLVGSTRVGRSKARLRLRVSNSGTGKANVNLSLPFGLVGTGLALARRFAPQHVPAEAELQEALAAGAEGKLLDVDNDGERVEIWVE